MEPQLRGGELYKYQEKRRGEMSSNIDYKTIIISIVFSVILSTATIMTVPQVQDALRGPQGKQGLKGVQGLQGPKGDTGDTGPKGDTGLAGPKGDTGDTGLAGPRGDTGDTGLAGPKGDTGEQGPAGMLGAPDFDSGWIGIGTGETYFEHNLGTQDLFVYMIGKIGGILVHQGGYGGIYYYTTEMTYEGAVWTTYGLNYVSVTRYLHDTSWDEVRVLIWKLPEPPT
jgi:hypothetical protein